MVIITTQKEFDEMIRDMNHSYMSFLFASPIMLDRWKHAAENKPCILVLRFDDHDAEYCIDLNYTQHSQINISALFTLTYDIIVPNKKIFLHLFPQAIDATDGEAMEFEHRGEITDRYSFIPKTVLKYYTDFPDRDNVHEIVPLMKLIEWAENQNKHLNTLGQEYGFKWKNNFHNDIVVPTCTFIESSGVAIDVGKFNSSFGINIKRDVVYTEYNPYTVTGRITNKFGGVNYAALNNTDGSKDSFVSRFGGDGALVLMDYDAFHLRLIASQIEFPVPFSSLHTYFGIQYFNKLDKINCPNCYNDGEWLGGYYTTHCNDCYAKGELTEEEYKQSKIITFNNMYSVERKYDHIPFFNSLYKFTDTLFEDININKSFKTFCGSVIKLSNIEDPNPGKVLNYLIQRLEMETAIDRMSEIIPLIRDLESKMVLYTYDSILFDFKLSELSHLPQIKSVLENGRKYPMRVSYGNTLGDMTKINN